MNIIAKVLYGIMDFFINKIFRAIGRFLEKAIIGTLDTIFFREKKPKDEPQEKTDEAPAESDDPQTENDQE